MKNICFFNSTKFWGGGEKLHLENALEFQKINYRVYLVSKYNSPLYKKAKSLKLKTFTITINNLSFLNPFKIIKLIKFYKQNKINTVVFSTSQDLKTGSIAAYIAKVEKIVYLRGLAIPIKKNLLNIVIFKHILTHIIPNSDETKRNILKNLNKYIEKEKIKTIYHGIDKEKLNNNQNNKLPEIQKKGHGIILGNAGRLTKQKGQDKLIETAKILHEKKIDFTLFIAGTGELKNELTNLINKYQLKNNVILLNFVNDMETFMNSIDIFVLSSEWEGFGFVLVEAMIKSKPVVAFNITSNPEIVINNETGYLVPFPDIEKFAEKIEKLINNKKLREKMGTKGLKTVNEKFILTDKILEINTFLSSSKTLKNKT